MDVDVTAPEARSRIDSEAGQPICVLGMHRSGTSLVTGMLHLCGVDLGPSELLMEPKPDNPSGFWEHLDVHTINEHLLARLGGSWHEPPLFEDGWHAGEEVEEFAQRAIEVIERDFTACSSWAFKDPRTCLLLPFWQRVVPSARYVVCVRNPLDVARSLRSRNHTSTRAATRLWALYTAAALHFTAGHRRYVLQTDRLLDSPWAELAELTRFLELDVSLLQRERARLEAFVDAGRWHYRSPAREALEGEEVDAICKLLYGAVLRSGTQNGEPGEAPDPELELEAELVWNTLAREAAYRQAQLEVVKLRAGLRRAEEELETTRDRLFETATRRANLEKWLAERRNDVERQALVIAELETRTTEQADRLSAITSSVGWQMLDRYRRLKQRLLAPAGGLARLYGGALERWRGRLLSSSAPSERVPPRVDFDPAAAAFQEPPALQHPAVATPAAWCRDARRPPVVVIVPTWNRLRYLRQCVTSLLEETQYPHHRICVFDQGSTDGTGEYLASLGDRLEAIHAPCNVGFVHANNLAVEAFPDWDVLFLNNDTRVTRGWLDTLVRTAYASEAIGLVGAKLVYPDGQLQEAGSQLFADGSARAYGKHEQPGDPRFNQPRQVDYCSASCLYVKRSVLDRCGTFDPIYSPCYYEDADLAMRAREAGFLTLYEPRATVVHLEHGTSSRETAIELMLRNRCRFVDRWRRQLARRPASLWQSPSCGRGKILFIGDIVPAPDRSAGGSRLFHLLRILAESYDVTYAFLKDQMIDEYLLPLERHGIHVFYPGYAKAVGDWELDLKAILDHGSYDGVVCSLHSVASRYLGLVRELSPRSRVLVDTYDVHFLRERREAEVRGDARLLALARATRDAELDVYRRADCVVTVTEQDRAALVEEDAELDVAIIPTLHEVPAAIRPREGRRDLLFVGGFSHAPNADAVLFFCNDILPLVHRHRPDLKLHVVGNAPPPEVLALSSDRVCIEGYTPHLRPWLESGLVSVAPLRFGSGMKGKIAEAMAYGLPAVTTSIGAEGMNLTDGEEVLIADDAERFADAVLRLCGDEELWDRLARNGYERVRREWTPAAVAPDVNALFRCLIGPGESSS